MALVPFVALPWDRSWYMLNRSQWHYAVIECCANHIPRGLTPPEPAVLPKNPAAPQPLRGPSMKVKVRVAVVKSKQPTVTSGRYAMPSPHRFGSECISETEIRIIEYQCLFARPVDQLQLSPNDVNFDPPLARLGHLEVPWERSCCSRLRDHNRPQKGALRPRFPTIQNYTIV